MSREIDAVTLPSDMRPDKCNWLTYKTGDAECIIEIKPTGEVKFYRANLDHIEELLEETE